MKQQILILTFVAMATISKGQTFAPIGAQWYYSSSANGAAPTGAEYYHYQSQLDTIVAGHSCKKISVTYYQYSGAITNQPSIYTYQKGDTVFYYNNIYSKYFPLYIFNVSHGDTLTFHSPVVPINPADTLWQAIVDSVTYFIVDSDTLKRVWTNDIGGYSFWGGYIEKLGCPFLMLPQPHGIFPEWDGPMRCYSDSSISYNFNAFPCDYRITSGIKLTENTAFLLIFPNPTSSNLNIEYHGQGRIPYFIYNSVGQILIEGRINSALTNISLDNLSGGFYNIAFSTSDGIDRRSFILIK
jgi:hypothetical protein